MFTSHTLPSGNHCKKPSLFPVCRGEEREERERVEERVRRCVCVYTYTHACHFSLKRQAEAEGSQAAGETHQMDGGSKKV